MISQPQHMFLNVLPSVFVPALHLNSAHCTPSKLRPCEVVVQVYWVCPALEESSGPFRKTHRWSGMVRVCNMKFSQPIRCVFEALSEIPVRIVAKACPASLVLKPLALDLRIYDALNLPFHVPMDHNWTWLPASKC